MIYFAYESAIWVMFARASHLHSIWCQMWWLKVGELELLEVSHNPVSSGWCWLPADALAGVSAQTPANGLAMWLGFFTTWWLGTNDEHHVGSIACVLKPCTTLSLSLGTMLILTQWHRNWIWYKHSLYSSPGPFWTTVRHRELITSGSFFCIMLAVPVAGESFLIWS